MASMEQVVVYCRLPVPGRVKTRLAATLGADAACTFYQACAEHVIAECSRWAEGSSSRQAHVHHSSNDDTAAVQAWVNSLLCASGIPCAPQAPDPCLGAKLHATITSILSSMPGTKVVVVGTDVPQLSADVLQQAFQALNQYELVLGPAADGGYYLIGAKGTLHSHVLEDIPWSTEAVLSTTLQHAAAAAIHVAPQAALPVLPDIDTEQDMRSWLYAVGMGEHQHADEQATTYHQVVQAARQVLPVQVEAPIQPAL